MSIVVRIREMTEDDLHAARAIASDLKDAPHWPPSAYDALLGPTARPERIAFVANDDENSICGFVIAALVSDTEAELESIAVEAKRQRLGVARRLFEELAARLRGRGIEDVFLEVRESNAAAQAFYRAQGFSVVGWRPAYYADPAEDALLMRVRVKSPKRS